MNSIMLISSYSPSRFQGTLIVPSVIFAEGRPP
jgi:hypothetical protein